MTHDGPTWLALAAFALLAPAAAGCGSDGSEADRLGIGATCSADEDCRRIDLADGGAVQLQCLTQFAAG